MRLSLRVLAAVLILTFSCSAQPAPPVDRLPQDTFFFFAWNGSAQIDKYRANNVLLRLWEDPDFAAAREILAHRAAREGNSSSALQSKVLTDAFLDVAANPFILGFSGTPDLKPAPKGGAIAVQPRPSGFFLIYDLTGKAEAHQKLLAMFDANVKEPRVKSTYTFSGTEILKLHGTRSVSYSATVGSYYVNSESKNVIETLITRLQGPAPADSVLQLAAYQAAAAHRTPDAFFEMFARVPDLTQMELPPADGVNVRAMLKGLHLERVRAITASGSLAGKGTRIRMAVLGDTAPGSLFDLFGASASDFRTLAVAPAGSAYSATRLDFVALYRTVRTALRAGMTPQQASDFEMLEAMMGSQLGMGIDQALQIMSGEIATIGLPRESAVGDSGDANSPLDPEHNLYAVAIDRHEEVLKLMRIVLASNITSDSPEGHATILAVTTSYRDEKTGAQRKRFNYVGVTPGMLIVAPRKALLREAIARVSAAQQGPATAGLAADPSFLGVRGRLPVQLTAMSYTDLSRLPLDFAVNTAIAEMNKKESEKLTVQEEEALRALPKIVARYLHTAFGGWWKERNGIFIDSYIE